MGIMPHKEQAEVDGRFHCRRFWNAGEELVRKGSFAWGGGGSVCFLQKACSFLFLKETVTFLNSKTMESAERCLLSHAVERTKGP